MPVDRPLYPMPIIVGAPRSGTTLLRFMLDAHPDLAIPPETGFLTLGSTLRGQATELRDRFFRAVVRFPETMPGWHDFGIPEETFRAALNELSPFTIADGFRCFYRLYAQRFGKSRWGDKTPLYCMHIDAIATVLPEARFIHIIRDGRDVALSLRDQWFSPGPSMDAQARAWCEAIDSARMSHGAEHYLEIRYEDLVLDTRSTLEQVCNFISLDMHESMLRYHERTPARLREHRARSFRDGTVITEEVRLRQQHRTMQGPDPSRVLNWRSEMSDGDRAAFERVAGPLLRQLGYQTTSGSAS